MISGLVPIMVITFNLFMCVPLYFLIISIRLIRIKTFVTPHKSNQIRITFINDVMSISWQHMDDLNMNQYVGSSLHIKMFLLRVQALIFMQKQSMQALHRRQKKLHRDQRKMQMPRKQEKFLALRKRKTKKNNPFPCPFIRTSRAAFCTRCLSALLAPWKALNLLNHQLIFLEMTSFRSAL